MTIYVLFRINFHSEREYTGVFSSCENAEAYTARFNNEKWEIEQEEIDTP
jgi:hypothetical protein